MREIYGLHVRGGPIRYVGQSSDARHRRDQHWDGRLGLRGKRLSRWLRTLPTSPEYQILAIVEDSEAFTVEESAITAYDSRHPGLLLNSQFQSSAPAPLEEASQKTLDHVRLRAW